MVIYWSWVRHLTITPRGHLGCVFLAFGKDAVICCGLDLDHSGLTANWLPIRQHAIYKLSVLTHKAGQPYYLADFIQPYIPLRALRSANFHLLTVPSFPRYFLHHELFVYFCLITAILFLFTYVHPTVFLLLNLILNLIFLLLLITTSHPHTSASGLIINFWRYLNVFIDRY